MMKASSILMLAFAALGLACIIPFNNRTLFENSTLLREFVGGILDKYPDDPAQGFAEVISAGDKVTKQAWPTGYDSVTRIKYCYSNYETLDLVYEDVIWGWQVWLASIGYPSALNGHSVVFEEHLSWDKKRLFCRQGRWGTDWNRQVPLDTVELKLVSDPQFEGAAASLAYIPPSWNNEGGRHTIMISHDFHQTHSYAHDRAVIIAHEIGHVMGFIHEHQREDRDHYVYYNCSNLANYQDVKKKAEFDGRNMGQVCSSWVLSTFYGLSGGSNYVTEPQWDRWNEGGDKHLWTVNAGKQYDTLSIMHYPSSDDDKGMEKAILLKWKYGSPTYKGPTDPSAIRANTELIKFNDVPSAEDLMGVIYIYPWGKK